METEERIANYRRQNGTARLTPAQAGRVRRKHKHGLARKAGRHKPQKALLRARRARARRRGSLPSWATAPQKQPIQVRRRREKGSLGYRFGQGVRSLFRRGRGDR